MKFRVFIACAILFVPASAFAETALLFPPSGDSALERPRNEAHQVLLQALQAQAIRVLRHADVTAGNRELNDCKTVDCASALLKVSGADVAVAVGVWAASADAVPSTVFVTLADRQGARYPGKVSVEGGDLALAVKEALLEARALQLLGPGPWLRVRGEPRGAQVLLNGTLVGTVPYRQPIESGRHTLQVHYEGYRSHAQTIDVPPSNAKQIDVDVALVSRDGEQAAAASESAAAVDDASGPEGRSGGKPVVGPLLLGGAGLLVVAADVGIILSSGCDRREPTGRCTEKVEINYPSAITFGAVGLGAMTGALLWYVLAEDENTEPGLAISMDGQTVQVAGRFGGL